MRIKSWSVPFLFLILCGVLLSRLSYSADYETNMSSNATGTSTTVTLPLTDPGDYLGSILINSRSSGPETLKVYDSSQSTNGLIGTINLSSGTATTGGTATANEYVYNLRLSSAITVTKSGASSDVTIIWKNIR